MIYTLLSLTSVHSVRLWPKEVETAHNELRGVEVEDEALQLGHAAFSAMARL
jgi:hypothetical protein